MALKAVKPEVVEAEKPKFLISGKSGVGKTMFALDFPSVYFIDCEGGATRPEYREKMVKNGTVYMGKEQGSQDFNTVIEEIKSLGTTKHEFKTLVIDSFSYLYNLAAAIAEASIGSDFGKDKKEANKPTRQLMRWIEKLDMSVVLICHQKDKWERNKAKELVYSGTTFDGFEKLEYTLDLWIECLKVGKERTFMVRKSRIHTLPEGQEFPLDYQKFSELYGKEIIEKKSEPLELATPEQVAEIKRLLDVVKLDDKTVDDWFTKADVDSWEEMPKVKIAKCIDALNKKITGGK